MRPVHPTQTHAHSAANPTLSSQGELVALTEKKKGFLGIDVLQKVGTASLCSPMAIAHRKFLKNDLQEDLTLVAIVGVASGKVPEEAAQSVNY